MIFVAYYTVGSTYEKLVKRLQASLEALHLTYDIQGYPSRGDWQANIAFKPEFIFEMLCKYPNQDIVYVDADAIIRQYPSYFDTFKGDIGIHYRDNHELLSGTIYLRNCEKVISLVKFWISEQQNHPTTWDQKTLQRVIGKHSRVLQLKVTNIPATYTQIFDTMKNVGKAVIEHFQESRTVRKEEALKSQPYPMGMNIRVLADGSFCIPRSNATVERYLDKNYTRYTNELRWYPRELDGKRIGELRSIFRGKRCYIVGKGASLDFLNPTNFADKQAPIFGVNEAIHKVESLNLPNEQLLIQQDVWLKETCRPKKAKIVLSYRIRNFYKDVSERYVFFAPEIGAPIACLTASYAICIAKLLGCTGIYMVCFDACVNRKTDYAKCVGYEPTTAGSPSRFLKHRDALLHYAGGIPVEWIIPVNPTVPA